MLLMPSLLFDDWTFWNPALAAGLVHDISRPLLGVTFRMFYELDGLVDPYFKSVPLFCFFSYLLSWICLYWALYLHGAFSRAQMFWIVTLSALAPLDFSRVQLSVYSVAFLSYALGALCFMAAVSRSRNWLRLVAAPLLLFACQVESFYFAALVLYAGVLVMHRDELRAVGRRAASAAAVRLAIAHAELFAIPILAFAIRTLLFEPRGIYANYNGIHLLNLLKAVPGSLFGAVYAFYAALASFAVFHHPNYGVSRLFITAAVIFALVIGLVSLTGRGRQPPEKPDILGTPFGLACAFLLVALLIYPYSVVSGGLGSFALMNFNDRHLLTAQLGFGLMAYAAVAVLVRPALRRLALTLMLALMMSGTAFGYLGLVRDGHLTNGLVAALKDNDEVRRGHTFVYMADEPSLWLGRNMAFYEWTNIFYRAYHDYTRLAVPFGFDFETEALMEPLSEIDDEIRRYRRYGGYAFQDYTPDDAPLELQWVAPPKKTPWELARLSYLRAFDPAAYEIEVKQGLRILVTPWKPPTAG